MVKKWWNEKVAYQIYPKSFYDTNGAEDEEIFDIYVDVLEKTGKTVQRSKIGTLI